MIDKLPASTGSILCLAILLALQLSSVHSASLRRAAQEPNSNEAISLTSGTTQDIEHLSAEETKLFVLEGLSLGDTVACTTNADEGDIDLFLRLDAPPVADPDGSSGIHHCDSIEYTSEELCVVQATKPQHKSVFVLLRAYSDSYNGTLSCTTTPLATLVRGVPLALDTVEREHDALFRLPVDAGEEVECTASGDEDLDLYLHWGAIPVPEDLEYSCSSAATNNRTEHCVLPAMEQDTTLYVLVDAWGLDVHNARIACTTMQSTQLEHAAIVSRMQPEEERVFRLEVLEDANIACWASASAGALKLAMALNEHPNDWNANATSSNCQGEVCVVDATAASTLFVQLEAKDAWTEQVHLVCAEVQDMLANGVATPPLSLQDPSHDYDFVLPVEAGDWVSCSVTAGSSQADVSLRIGHDAIPRDGLYNCHGNKACGYFAESDGVAVVSLQSSSSTPGTAVLQCWSSQGLVVDQPTLVGSPVLAAREERLLFLTNVAQGASVDCWATPQLQQSLTEEVALSMRFDEPPDRKQGHYDCSSRAQTSLLASAQSVCPFEGAPHDGTLYIAVENLGLTETPGVQVTCSYQDTTHSDPQVVAAKELLAELESP